MVDGLTFCVFTSKNVNYDVFKKGADHKKVIGGFSGYRNLFFHSMLIFLVT